MKKLTAIILVLTMLATLAACQGDARAAATDTSVVTESTNEQMQASEITPTTTEGDEVSTAGQTDARTPTTTEPLAFTEPGTEKTEQGTRQTDPSAQPTQPTTPPVTEPPHQHSYSTTVIAPTCSDKGYTKHTCACGNSYNDNYTAALGHHYIDEVIAPTSSAQGYTKHTCDRCGYSYNDTYTDPVKVVYDINAAMEAGNAYALSIGFHSVNYDLTPANAGYYPYSTIEGYILAQVGGQSWLEQEMIGKAQSCKDRLIYIRGENAHAACTCRAYITYDAATDTYCCYFLYA